MHDSAAKRGCGTGSVPRPRLRPPELSRGSNVKDCNAIKAANPVEAAPVATAVGVVLEPVFSAAAIASRILTPAGGVCRSTTGPRSPVSAAARDGDAPVMPVPTIQATVF